MKNTQLISEISRIKELMSLVNEESYINESLIVEAPGPYGKLVDAFLSKTNTVINNTIGAAKITRLADDIASLSHGISREATETPLEYVRRVARNVEDPEILAKMARALEESGLPIDNAFQTSLKNSIKSDATIMDDLAKNYNAKELDDLLKKIKIDDAAIRKDLNDAAEAIRKTLPPTDKASIKLAGLQKTFLGIIKSDLYLKIPQTLSRDVVAGIKKIFEGTPKIAEKLESLGTPEQVKKYMDNIIDTMSKDTSIKSLDDAAKYLQGQIDDMVKDVATNPKISQEVKKSFMETLKTSQFTPKLGKKGLEKEGGPTLGDKFLNLMNFNIGCGLYFAGIQALFNISYINSTEKICRNKKSIERYGINYDDLLAKDSTAASDITGKCKSEAWVGIAKDIGTTSLIGLLAPFVALASKNLEGVEIGGAAPADKSSGGVTPKFKGSRNYESKLDDFKEWLIKDYYNGGTFTDEDKKMMVQDPNNKDIYYYTPWDPKANDGKGGDAPKKTFKHSGVTFLEQQ